MISRILIVLAALATLPGYIIASEKLATHSLEWAIAHDIVLGVAIVTLIWLLGLSVLFAWRKLQIKLIKTTEEARPGKFVRLVGDPIFDPNKGVYFNGAGEDGQMHKIVIEPKWWHLLPRSAISRDGEAEAAVLNGSYSSVLPGTEPSSLVMLKVGEVTVGFGSRVQYKGCSDYLLTAHHVVAPHAELNLCKRGLVVKLSEDILESTYESASEAVDFVMIKVPSNYWSKLGVGVGKLTTMTKRTTVTLYGGSNSMGLISSQGSAYKGRTGFAIIHEAPTTRGWSGTPLYQGNFIVGIHTGCGKLGETNCATNVNLLLELSSTQESNFSENSYSEIDEDNFVLRANREEYMEVEIKGKGKFLLGDADYINVTDKPSNWEKLKKARGEEIWEDAEDTEEQLDNYFKTSLVSWYNKGKETAAQFCKGAAEPVVEVTTDNLLESFKLPAGGHIGRCCATLIRLAEYQWQSPEIVSTRGMPLTHVGRTSCKFREALGKELGSNVQDAARVFPELKEYGWPRRGSEAEFGSLTYQAGRFRPSEPPKELFDAVRSLAAKYPRTAIRRVFRTNNWSKEEIAKEAEEIGKTKVNPKASPGVPLSILGQSNAEVLNRHGDLVYLAVAERLIALSEADLEADPSPRDLIRLGLCDPIRLFVKNEPHPIKKIEEGRFRLISSVSLVDQLVERLLFGPQNEAEIAQWQSVPSKPGMGLSQKWQQSALWRDLENKHRVAPAAEADISGFDWSVQKWELEADVCIRIERGKFPERMKKAALNRFKCFANAVFQLSNGELIEQGLPGLMKSGSYCTSSTNSRIRCLMAEIIKAPWCIAMGDDSVEGFVENAREKYDSLGHTCKDYVPCATSGNELKEINFCSHSIGETHCYLQTWAKTLFRFLSHPDDFDELAVELQGCPQWPRIRNYLCRIGRISDKIYRIRGNGEESRSEESEEEDGPRSGQDSNEENWHASTTGYGPSCHYGGDWEVGACAPL
nr:polyprotein 2ab [Solemoviridae sp.]